MLENILSLRAEVDVTDHPPNPPINTPEPPELGTGSTAHETRTSVSSVPKPEPALVYVSHQTDISDRSYVNCLNNFCACGFHYLLYSLYSP